MSHRTGWEEEQMAELFCGDKKVVGQVLQAGEVTTCENCGKDVKLIWDVYIEEEGKIHI